jgi:glucosyl-3-phosphoglycerate phosphatase
MEYKNRYIFFRHGQSQANLQDLVCSLIENGALAKYGLTPLGQSQVIESVKKLKAELLTKGVALEKLIMLSSSFSRALQTALLIRDELGIAVENCSISGLLFERAFAPFELKKAGSKDGCYQITWEADLKKDYPQELSEVEKPQALAKRLTKLISFLEQNYDNKTIILVSHGDPIMIARTIFLGVDPSTHHTYPYILNAEYLIF